MSLCNLALLGATGSIGKSALAVARALPDRIRVSLLPTTPWPPPPFPRSSNVPYVST